LVFGRWCSTVRLHRKGSPPAIGNRVHNDGVRAGANSRERSSMLHRSVLGPQAARVRARGGNAAMDIKPLGSMPSRRPPADYFTGTVWQDPIIEAPAPARIRGAFVRFEPRARTAWHTHPLGQTLHVISGVGRVALWGGPVREIRAGDTVWIAP